MNKKTRRSQIKVDWLKSIRARIMLSFLFALLIPFGLVAFITIQNVGDSLLEQTLKTEEAAGNQLQENIRNRLAGYIDFSTTLVFDRRISEYFTFHYINRGESAEGYYTLIKPTIEQYERLYPDTHVTIYTNNSTMMYNDLEISYIRPGSPEEALFREASSARGKVKWKLSITEDNNWSLTLFRILKQNDINDVGFVAIRIKEQQFFDFMKEGREGSTIYLISPEGDIVTSTNPDKVGTSVTSLELGTSLDAGEASFAMKDGTDRGKKAKVLIFSFPVHEYSEGKWMIVKTIATDSLLAQVNRSKRDQLFMYCLMFAFAMITAGLIAGSITGRIKRLARSMKQVQQGDFAVSIAAKRDDEFGYLEGSFNVMVARLQELIAKVVQIETEQKETLIKKRDAELYALQSQVNPHFLFNTLEAILHGMEEDRREAADIIHLLAKSFRRTLQWKMDLIALEDELQFVEDYLVIQKYRMKDRLGWSFIIDEEARPVKIPKMLLQVAVENAVLHGISMSKKGGELTLTAQRTGACIRLCVADNGIGMPEQTVDMLRRMISEDPFSQIDRHVGLKNVSDRLRLWYGSRSSVEIESALESGTAVSFIFYMTDLNRGDVS
ncbi:cache domain-containing sensor histidine kinase [Gorillibacterium massiliense]|uniref:cache domain-containing sensor histidine kinase n=1 Tax=Gorillibacterium massiliense TaxID=1280390 RepID=UPI0004AEDA50|nr:sensor histidine kinase [Gorillibacterium massiliense]